ncbi:MAG: tetratricopeptide repeat protein [Mediterranea sp.]|nr:tetratricopeptide repeat protein [Mediterranea sp.]
MKRLPIIYVSLLWGSLLCGGLSAQTLEQARALFAKGEYEQAKPAFQRLLKSSPSNANYNYWYGVCCLKTGDADSAVKPLELAVKRKVSGGQLYLGQAYDAVYRFEEAVSTLTDYVAELEKRKRPTDEGNQWLEKCRTDLRMLKGTENVCVVDSFVVDKDSFLTAYRMSEESGKLYTYNDYFCTEGDHPGTVYATEIGNKIYYSEQGERGTLDIFLRSKLIDDWSQKMPLPGSINERGNANYPYVMSDGITIYYASDGDGLGGYDIFVTRYNTNNDTYLVPENVGMPFNSPYNDYMYAVDEYNNLGWFASDRYQPEGKVCVYVFVPNETRQPYNYETTDRQALIGLAQLRSLRATWKDEEAVEAAQGRLQMAINHKPKASRTADFVFVINDQSTYYQLADFKSARAKQLFQRYQQMRKDYLRQEDKLDNLRQQYATANARGKESLAPAILDLERRTAQMAGELDAQATRTRNAEIRKEK